MPKLSLARKLTLAFLLVAVTAALLMAVFIRLTNAGQLNQLVLDQQRGAFETTLVSYYQSNGSWNGVMQYLQSNRNAADSGAQPTPQAGYSDGTGYGRGFGGRGPGGDHGLFFGLVDSQGVVIIPPPNYPPRS